MKYIQDLWTVNCDLVIRTQPVVPLAMFMCSDGYVLLPRMKAMHSDDKDEDDDSDDEWD